jgi:hypothetical protein
MSSRPKTAESTMPSPVVQQVVSLLLVLHLFCIVLAMSTFTRRSGLQERLLDVFAPYTRMLYLAPTSAVYQLCQYDALTGGYPRDDDHYLEIEFINSAGERESHALDEQALGVPESKRRYREYAALMFVSSLEDGGNEYYLGEMAKSAAKFAMQKYDVDVATLRLKRHLSQPRSLSNLSEGFPADPNADQYKLTSFEADMIWDRDEDEILLVKREDKAQVSPVIQPTKPSPPREQGKSP